MEGHHSMFLKIALYVIPLRVILADNVPATTTAPMSIARNKFRRLSVAAVEV